MKKVLINSEIGKLKKVIVHRPGEEIEKMTPENSKELLYDDILELSTAVDEHDIFTSILNLHSDVYEFTDLFEDVARDEKQREFIVKDLLQDKLDYGSLYNKLMSMCPKDFVNAVVGGIVLNREEDTSSLFDYLSVSMNTLQPLPNMFFTRDMGIIINDFAITGPMASKVRAAEAIITKHILSNHKDFLVDGFYFENDYELPEGNSFEGGDILVIREDVVAIGLSERTSSKAIDQLIIKFKEREIIKYIFVVVIPKMRATIHLDMVFTMLDKNYVCVHEPVILGAENHSVVCVNISEEITKFTKVPNLIKGLQTVGIDLEPVICGGNDPITQTREQWMCGANFFTLAPGKVIGYSRNVKTFEQLEKVAKMPRIEAIDIINGKVNLNDYDRYAIAFKGSELSRAGGGARCMTMPILRDEVDW